MSARIFDTVSRLVGELAEVHFPGMARKAQHIYVGAGTENPWLDARDDDSPNFRMLETNPLQSVVQFDIDAQIIRIQLELVPRTDSAVLLHAHRKRGAAAFNRYAPMSIMLGRRLEIDKVGNEVR